MTTSVDPTAAQILGNYMHVAANEAELALIRAAYSPVIKETFDCSAAILGPDGSFWGQADAIPLQLGVLSDAQRAMMKDAPDDLAPGDILLSNDPQIGAPHLNDFVALAPVFVDGEIFAYVAALAHNTDVGGKVPGSMPSDSTDLFQEGFCLPTTRIVARGEIDRRMMTILLANTRTPANMEADFGAQFAACRLGVRRVLEAVEKFGAETVTSRMEYFLDYSNRLGRVRLAQMRPGTYTATRKIDNEPGNSGEPAQVTASVTIGPDGVEVDFSLSSDQLRRPLNVVPSNGYSVSLCALRSVLGADVPFNGGIQRLLRVGSRLGSIMNPAHPAPVGARAAAAALAYQCVIDAFGQSSREVATASSSGGTTMPYVWAPDPEPGRAAQIMVDNSLTGGSGARPGHRGLDAVENSVTNAINLSTEMMEQEFPVLVERYEIREHSGGLGRWDGGDGMRRIVRFLKPGVLSLRGYGRDFPPMGADGGADAQPSRFRLRTRADEIDLPGQISGVRTAAGDVLIAETPGGGGYGSPPNERPDSA